MTSQSDKRDGVGRVGWAPDYGRPRRTTPPGDGAGQWISAAVTLALLAAVLAGTGERRNEYHYMRGWLDGHHAGVDAGVRTAMGE